MNEKQPTHQSIADLRITAEKGNAPAQYNLGMMYLTGKGGPQDDAEARKWLTKAAEQEHIGAQFSLATVHRDNGNYKEAQVWFTKSADQGDLDSLNDLGMMYYNGQVDPKNKTDQATAIKLLKKAAIQSNLSAQCNLGNILLKAKKYEEARVWFTKAADQEDLYSQCQLGVMSYFGMGCPIDYKKARRLLTKAAAQNANTTEDATLIAEAKYLLGRIYFEGKGVPKNQEIAKKWLTEAAEQGNADAQYQLGLIHNNSGDLDNAVKWLTEAAEQGNADAQLNLGIIYRDKKDYVTSIKWCRKATDQGSQLAEAFMVQVFKDNLHNKDSGIQFEMFKIYCRSIKQANQDQLKDLYGSIKTYIKDLSPEFISSKDKNGNNLLHIAAVYGDIRMITALLVKCKSVNINIINDVNKYGWGPLTIAAAKGHIEIAQLLIKQGAKVDVTKEGWTTLHYIAGNGQGAEMLEFIIQQDKSVVNAKNEAGNTPLHIAATNDNITAIDLLIDHGANINSVNKNGKTALDLAVKKGYKTIAACLKEEEFTTDEDVDLISEARWQARLASNKAANEKGIY